MGILGKKMEISAYMLPENMALYREYGNMLRV